MLCFKNKKIIKTYHEPEKGALLKIIFLVRLWTLKKNQKLWSAKLLIFYWCKIVGFTIEQNECIIF